LSLGGGSVITFETKERDKGELLFGEYQVVSFRGDEGLTRGKLVGNLIRRER